MKGGDERSIRNSQRQPQGKALYPYRRIQYLCRYWNPLQVEKLTMVCCPQAQRPQTSWTWSLMMLTPTYLTTDPSEECPWADHTLFEQLLQNFYLPSWDSWFEGISPLWPPLPGKVIKLSFSILPKTLALRFNSVYREAECSAPEWQFLKRVANLAQPSVASKWNKLVQTQPSSESTLQVLSKKKEVI